MYVVEEDDDEQQRKSVIICTDAKLEEITTFVVGHFLKLLQNRLFSVTLSPPCMQMSWKLESVVRVSSSSFN